MNNITQVLKGTELIERFESVSPPWMMYNAELGFAVQQLKANSYTSKIAENNPNSLMAAMANVAACGLSLNPAKKEAYLVPRKGNVCLDPSYIGIAKLATDAGSILWVQAKLVYTNDSFTTLGVDEKPVHKCDPFKDRGPIVGVYVVVLTHDGSYLTETMAIGEVHAIRDRSEAYKANPQKTPWFTDEGEMIKKTCVKRASKLWPKSDNHDAERRLAMAVQTSYENEDVKLPTTTPDLGQVTDEQKIYFDQLISQGNALEMYVLSQTTSSTEFANLYHSFGKGEKGKYQRIVDELIRKGADVFDQYLAEFQDGGDVESEVSASAYELINSRAV